MTNKAITALPAATALAGTEVLPIVQSGITVKVTADDLTVKNIRSNATSGILQITGPAAASTRVVTVPNANWLAARADAAQSFTGDQTLATGNLVQGTASKGINFTANTPAAGMTSQLLNWYEKGTWTVTATCDTGSITLGSNILAYTRIGRSVSVCGQISVSSVAAPAGNVFFTLPFRASAGSTGVIYLADINAISGEIPVVLINSGQSQFYTQKLNQSSGVISGAASIFKAGSYFNVSVTYVV